jgi:ligand-binding sensor domain-containing protein
MGMDSNPGSRHPPGKTRVLAILLALALGMGAFLGATPSGPPPGRIPFQSYGTLQGLDNLSIWCLEQDSDGFLWVGTEDGLFRYDGWRFRGFGRECGLPTSWIRTLCAGAAGRLWIGTTHGLALREAGRIRTLAGSEGLPKAEVFALAMDRTGRLWVATDRGLFWQRNGTQAFEAVPGWPERALARSLWMDGPAVYVTSQSRLLRFDLDGPGRFQEEPGPWKERLDAVLKDALGRLWVRSRSGLWMRPSPGAPFQDLSGRVGPAPYDGALRWTAEGTLLIPTVGGLMRVHGRDWDMLGEPQGLPTPYANRSLVDREGCLWVGGLGLHRTLSREAWRQHTVRDGIVGGVVRAILRDRRGCMWVGTTDGVCKAQGGAWAPIPETRQQAILAIALAPDGALWLGGAPGRLRRWVPGSSRWLEFPQPESTITNLAFDPEGHLWVATRRQGLFRVTREVRPGHPRPVHVPRTGRAPLDGHDHGTAPAGEGGLAVVRHQGRPPERGSPGRP